VASSTLPWVAVALPQSGCGKALARTSAFC